MSIRTPEDEIDRPGYFYPPFKEGWWYQGATYPGHSDFSVDFNRRTQSGGWLNDAGDPVLAAADGTVAEVLPAEGLVLLNHHGALWRTEYRHMRDIPVKKGDKVQRGDRIGSIGDEGNAPNGTHLHHVHYRRASTDEAFQRTRMRFEGVDVAQSVGDSDSRPATWKPPEPKLYQGPPPRATWEGAYREAARLIDRKDDTIAEVKGLLAAVREERDILKARVAELEAATPPDCAAVEAERDGYRAQAEQLTEDMVAQAEAMAVKAAAREAEWEAWLAQSPRRAA